MTTLSIVLLVLLTVGTIYTIGLYNGLVGLKNGVSKAWANIDVLLKQRHDEIPKLVDVCKRYMQHERETLDSVIKARADVSAASQSRDMTALGSAEGSLRRGLSRLLALAEAYPDLKATEQFSHLQGRISNLENAIADRRELYNESVNLNNTGVEEFPAVLLAPSLGFRRSELLRFSAEETVDINVRSLFKA